ncbi:MAG: tripartite tricarboxylate transporter TctB family protein [Planctomycetota bacterium]|jgi:hypothetical protein|nr:tripartite tricarboxylate transporter TctB family protein [Planctomycetota bacterium]
MKKGNLIAAAAFAALAAFIIWESREFPASKGNVPGPAVFPVAIAVLMLLSAAALAFTTLCRFSGEERKLDLLRPDCLRVYLCMGVLMIYAALVPLIGFLTLSVPTLIVFIRWFGGYRLRVCALSSLAVNGVIYLVFSELLHVPFRFGFLP